MSEELHILNNALSSKAPLTNEIHKQFWDSINRNYIGLDKDRFIETLENSSVYTMLSYYRETWQSAEQSYEKSKIVVSPELEILLNNFRARFPKPNKSTLLNSDDIKQAKSLFYKYIASLEESSDKVIRLSSQAKSQIAKGEKPLVSKKLIKEMLLDIKNKETKWNNLLNENWVPE